MTDVTYYFDFVSPFSYFGLLQLDELPAGTQVRLQPILFAGVLNHWGQKGPAEIAPKRVWTYQTCVWRARQRGWPFRAPACHPFNPLPYLRLAIAAGNEPAAVRRIFDRLWTTGADPRDAGLVNELSSELHVDAARLADQSIKVSLRLETERAVARGVFGVPTLAIDDHLFWGSDAFDFAAAYLRDPSILSTEEMQRVATLPAGADRLLR